MLSRLTISLPPELQEELQQMAEEDCRALKDEVIWLIKEEARRRGNRFNCQGSLRDPEKRIDD